MKGARYVRVPSKGAARRYGIDRATVLRAVEVFGFALPSTACRPGGPKYPTDRQFRLTFMDGTPVGNTSSLSGWRLARRGDGIASARGSSS